MSVLELVRTRFNEAVRVREAWDEVLVRHRAAWHAARPGPDAERERRLYSAALMQRNAAKRDEDLAWDEWQLANG